jgi:hypothetical protein
VHARIAVHGEAVIPVVVDRRYSREKESVDGRAHDSQFWRACSNGDRDVVLATGCDRLQAMIDVQGEVVTLVVANPR